MVVSVGVRNSHYKKGLSLLFTFDLRACDRCVDLDVKLDPDSTVTRGVFFSFFSALNFLFFFFHGHKHERAVV